ncbi:MAG: hypothetical protein V8Q57_03530 [Blautia sp.]
MHLYLKFFGLALPSYGLMIATGIITANILAFFCLLQDKKDINDFLILEAGGFLAPFWVPNYSIWPFPGKPLIGKKYPSPLLISLCREDLFFMED